MEALDAQILDLTPNAELEEEIGRAEEHFERVQRALLKIRRALKDTLTRERTRLRTGVTREAARDDGLTDEVTGDDSCIC